MKRLQPYLLPLSAVLLIIPALGRFFRGNPLIPSGSFPELMIIGSIALGVFSAYLFSLLSKRLTKSPRLQTLLVLVWSINPIFLTLFTSISPLVLAVPLALIMLLTQRKAVLVVLSIVLVVLDPVFALLFLATIWRRNFLPASLLAVALILFRGSIFHTPGLVLSEFGALPGLSLLLVALALLECVRRWPERKPLLPFFLLLVLTPFIDSSLVLAGLVSAPLAAFFIDIMERRTWSIKEAKPLALLLIGCGLLFLLISQLFMLVQAEPTNKTIQLLERLPDDSTVLAPAEFHPFIERFTNANALDSDTASAIYITRKQAEADVILERHGITYLLITEDIRKQWSHDEDGLLFLLKHSEKFKKVAESQNIELWQYVKP